MIACAFAAMAVVGFNCGKSKPENKDTAADPLAAPLGESPRKTAESQPYQRVPGYKERLNNVMDEGAVEREKRVQKIFE